MALKHHPDLHLFNKAAAEEQFKQLQEAYSVLSNSEKRRLHDERQGFHDNAKPNSHFDNEKPNINHQPKRRQKHKTFDALGVAVHFACGIIAGVPAALIVCAMLSLLIAISSSSGFFIIAVVMLLCGLLAGAFGDRFWCWLLRVEDLER